MGNLPLMTAFNLLDFLKYRVADFYILSIFGLTLRPQVGAVVVLIVLIRIPVTLLLLEDGVEDLLIPL